MIFALPLSRSGKVFFSFLCGRTRNKAPREQTIAFLLPEWSEDFWFVLYVDTERSASCEELSGQQVEEVACVTSGLVTFSGARDSCFSLQKRPLYEGCSLTWAVSSHPCPRFPPARLVALSEHSSGGADSNPTAAFSLVDLCLPDPLTASSLSCRGLWQHVDLQRAWQGTCQNSHFASSKGTWSS